MVDASGQLTSAPAREAKRLTIRSGCSCGSAPNRGCEALVITPPTLQNTHIHLSTYLLLITKPPSQADHSPLAVHERLRVHVPRCLPHWAASDADRHLERLARARLDEGPEPGRAGERARAQGGQGQGGDGQEGRDGGQRGEAGWRVRVRELVGVGVERVGGAGMRGGRVVV